MRGPTQKSDDLGDVPSLVAGESRARAGAAKPAASRGRTPAPAGGSGGSSIAVLVMLALILVGGGWLFYVEHEQLQLAQASLAQANDRIRLLEERLQVTGADLSETLTETGEEMKSQLGYWEGEIRKLWDVTNKRNKEWIQQNSAAIDKLEEATGNQQALLDRLDALTAQHEKALGTGGVLTAKLAQVERAVANMAGDQQEAVDKAKAAAQAANALKANIAELEQAVEAMNAFRAQMNRNLQTVTADITALKAQLAGPP
jgi:chromosome segregation ATPase